jgi:hypothetical protein
MIPQPAAMEQTAKTKPSSNGGLLTFAMPAVL